MGIAWPWAPLKWMEGKRDRERKGDVTDIASLRGEEPRGHARKATGRNYLTRNIHQPGRPSWICVGTAFQPPWLWETGQPPSDRGTRFQSCHGSIHRSLR